MSMFSIAAVMTRLVVLAVAFVAVFGMVVPAMAQAPAPKVTITGLIDNVGTYARNVSAYDFNLNRSNDAQMYGRTRGRFDIIGEVGKAKGVLGLEIDAYWGQTGFTDSNIGPGCVTAANSASVTCGAVGSGAESSFDLNTDTQGSIQVKWLYAEFPLPLIPLNSVVRLGAQPFGTAATYKLAAYANGDFPGVNLVVDLAPGAKLNLTWVSVEEDLTGKRDFLPFFSNAASNLPSNSLCANVNGSTAVTGCTAQSRGDDWAIIASFEMSPFKGLDIKPMYSYFHAAGTTSGAARQGRGGIAIASPLSAFSGGFSPDSPFAPLAVVAGADGAGTGVTEARHTLGVDARFTAGPFSLQPTILYQFGTRDAWIKDVSGALDQRNSQHGALNTKRTADISAWLIDIRGDFRVGPLSLGGLFMWTSGNNAKDNLFNDVNFYQPLSTDTSYLNGWGTQILTLGTDYYQILNGGAAQAGLNPGVAIGYDRYGRMTIGASARYALTPALTVGAAITANWTDKAVDTDSALFSNAGLTPSFIDRRTGRGTRPEGESDYLGTDVGASLTYRFAPGLTFDYALGYLFAGPALAHRYLPFGGYSATLIGAPPVSRDIGVNDVFITTARVRYEF